MSNTTNHDTAWTFDDRAPGLTLDRLELQRAVIRYGRAAAAGCYQEEMLHWNRIRDLLYPTLDPAAPVVPIESLGPACARARGEG